MVSPVEESAWLLTPEVTYSPLHGLQRSIHTLPHCSAVKATVDAPQWQLKFTLTQLRHCVQRVWTDPKGLKGPSNVRDQIASLILGCPCRWFPCR